MTRRLPRLLSIALAVPATLRLTRLITRDWLGEWLIVAPVRDWAIQAEAEKGAGEGWQNVNLTETQLKQKAWERIEGHQPLTWQGKLFSMFECPFCVGFWLGLVVLVAAVVTPKPLRGILNVVLGALGLNYVVGHVSSRID